jgi:hypothetical protein
MTRRRAILLAIILTAFWLRFWRLPGLPPGLWYDEAYHGMDAVWMAHTGQYPLFFVGNNGREAMWPYLVLVSTWLLGNITFAMRWVAALVGVLTIPVLYRFAFDLLRPYSPDLAQRHRLALIATGWLAVSWWHLHLSRAGFRPILLPPLLMLSLHFWLAGIKNQTTSTNHHASRLPLALNFSLAGLFLGLSQYTYLPARLAPLIFAGLIILGSLQAGRSHLRRIWTGVLITGFTALLIFVPLGLFFFRNPDTFVSRTGDVIFSPDQPLEIVRHLGQAMSLFLGASHELFRHHLPGRAMLGWLEIPFFWMGLVWLLRPARLRWPETQLLLLGMGVMWLPALLASPPVHALRPVGLLPFYYLIVTLGLAAAAKWLVLVTGRRPRIHTAKKQTSSNNQLPLFILLVVTIITLNGLINTYDYFQRWANQPDVYQEYNGPLVDLTKSIIDLTRTSDVIMPLHVYVHPTTRFLLWSAFPEKEGPPPASERPLEMLLVPSAFQLLYVGNIPESSALVLLTRDLAGGGAAYVSRPPRVAEQLEPNDLLTPAQARVKPFQDKLGRTLAYFSTLPPFQNPKPNIQNLFDPAPLRTIELNWADLAQLTGYEVTPQLVRPGQPVTLNLYWHSLTDKTFDSRLFLQLIDGAGNPINQWEGEAFREDMYRWRPDGILPTQHTLWLGPDTVPGPYLVRLGFFDPATGQRLPLRTAPDASPVDQVHLGLFYVSPDGSDPRQPAIPLSATFAGAIELIGLTPSDQAGLQHPTSTIEVALHWQAIEPTDLSYTVFLQLLDEQGELISGWDRQPFDGRYPTDCWSPGEIIVDTFQLPLPEAGLAPGMYRLITGFYDGETGRRLIQADGSDFAELSHVTIP